MCHGCQCTCFLELQVGGYQQHCIGTCKAGFKQLVLIYYKVLAQYGFIYQRSGFLQKVQTSAKVLAVGEDAQGGSTVPGIGWWNDIGLSVLLDPAF